ncbi:MAG TPA: extracellular solute-binding protein [Candidatus Eisenbergiella merdipullorum]|uniref:Extracellular solute-binding protein n=1 Tax=Candidatus Eisenbergiella merdipullorum TaxID=2838553 RepID=A0A9D2I643_9FIRM|nr:extracellular solute-binding protein [Candidatus Eisenbergiella merdipullorum]
MKRSVSRALAVVLGGIMLFSGCGQSAGNKVTQSQTDSTVVQEESQTQTANVAEQDNVPVNEEGEPDSLGTYREPITLKIAQSVNPSDTFPEGQSAEDNAFFDWYRDNLNVNVEILWQAGSGSDYSEKLNLAIASGDLPDIFSASLAQVRMLSQADMIEDLTPYYEEFVNEVIRDRIDNTNGQAMNMVTFDGKMMAMPNVQPGMDSYSLLWIRQDWLDELGLEAPKTIEEIRTVAKAFVDNKMGGEGTIGLLSPTSGNALYSNFINSGITTGGLDGIFQANRAYPGYWLKDENGEVIYGSLTEETRSTLQVLSEMYKEGTLDPELGTRKDADEAWKSGKVGMMFAAWWLGYNVADAVAADPNAEWIAYPYPLTDDGKWAPHMQSVSNSFYVVRKGYEHPEVLILIQNWLYGTNLSAEFDQYGINPGYIPGRLVIGVNKPEVSDNELIREYLETGEIPEYNELEHSRGLIDMESAKEIKKEPYDDMGIETWNVSSEGNFGRIYSILIGGGAIDQGYDIGCEEVYSEFYGETENIQKKWSVLQKAEDETFLKIILGTEPIESFDTFVEDWYAQGGTEIIQEVSEMVK